MRHQRVNQRKHNHPKHSPTIVVKRPVLYGTKRTCVPAGKAQPPVAVAAPAAAATVEIAVARMDPQQPAFAAQAAGAAWLEGQAAAAAGRGFGVGPVGRTAGTPVVRLRQTSNKGVIRVGTVRR